MCGRFVSSSPPDEVARYFGALPPPETAVEADYNVAPTADINVVLVEGGGRHLRRHHWGLVPYWAKDPAIGNRLINARADGLARNNSFRNAFARRRCIVPVDGFYEWQVVAGTRTKQPYYVHPPDGGLFALAGLWEEWRRPGGEPGTGDGLRSTTIVTTTPNEPLAAIHDRMPVILPAEAWEQWLAPDVRDAAALSRLLVPAPPEAVAMHPVSTEVGNVRNTGAHLVDPVEITTTGPEEGGTTGGPAGDRAGDHGA